MDSFIQAGQIELSAALIDDRLSLLVAAAFTACNKDFWTKIEAHIKLGTDSKQVVGAYLAQLLFKTFFLMNFSRRCSECFANSKHNTGQYCLLSQSHGETIDSESRK